MVSSTLAAGLGRKTAIIERRNLGGECTWYGCVPSKALIKAANVYHYAAEAVVSTTGSPPQTPPAPRGAWTRSA